MRENIMSKITKTQQNELTKLARLSDAEIDTSDIPEINWDKAVRGKFYRPIKQQITLRLDADMVAWFRGQGRKYQTRMNSALRDYMNSNSDLS